MSISSNRFKQALCVYPYRRELNDAGFFPPLGLEFISALVQRYADAIDMIDLRRETGDIRDFILPETDLVCLSLNWDRDQEFLQSQIRAIPENILTIAGGRHATENPQRWLEDFPNVDILVRGDGEEAMEEILRGVPLGDIPGISFRKDGEIVHNENRILGELADDLYPNRCLRRHKYVATIKGASTGIRVDCISTSRGCPFACKFCSFNLNPWGEKRRWTGRSAESVVDELSQMDAKLVGFTDDLFTRDMERVERICDLLIERKIRKRYFVNARLEISKHPDVLEKMHRAGFSMLMLGIESANDKTLKSMQKGFDTEKIAKHFEILRQSKMFLHGYFILGCIGESRDEMLKIAPFAHELGVDTLALSTLRTEEHSALNDMVIENPGYHFSASGKVYSDELSIADIRKLRKTIYRQFYTPGQILRVGKKGLQNSALSFMPSILPRTPMILAALAKQSWKKSRRRARKRRDARVEEKA